jgi:hypothetical protein
MTTAEALRLLSEAAAPYQLRIVKNDESLLPDLVLFRPRPDGRPVGRLQYFEPDVGQPYLRSLIVDDVSQAEQAVIEQHMRERLAPVILRIFSFTLWVSLADGATRTS